MKKLTSTIVVFLIGVALILASLVTAQTGSPDASVKGKPATSNTVKMIMTRAVRRSSSSSLMSVGDTFTFPPVPPPSVQSREPQFVPNQVLVKLESRDETKSRLNLTTLQAAKLRNEALRAEVQENLEATNVSLVLTKSVDNPRDGDLLVMNLPVDTTPDQAINELRDKPGVKSVQKNWVYTLQQNPVSNDSEYVNGALWGMFGDDMPNAIGPGPTTNSFGTQAEKAWFNGHLGSRTVFVGIIDGGVQVDHPDLTANIWTNPGETGPDGTGQDKSTNGKDDDGDGLKDDVRGWDFAHQDGSVYDGEAPDEHGTHVAGTIGAAGSNNSGVVGVNWNVTIIPAKVFGATGATTDRIVEAINYFVRLRERGVNVVAINNSWGGGPYDSSLFEAIKHAARAGILFIAAAGNYGQDNDGEPFYPASYDTQKDTRSEGGTAGVDYDSVISVAAIDRNGSLPKFSDFGQTSVDLGAPGDTIESTIPRDDYGFMSGTSMATPHVTGAAALYASAHPPSTPVNPRATAKSIRTEVLGKVISTPSLQGKTATGGRINVGGF